MAGSRIFSALSEAAPKAGLAFKSVVSKDAASKLAGMATQGGEVAAKGGMGFWKAVSVPVWGPFWLAGQGVKHTAIGVAKGVGHVATRPIVWGDKLGGKAINGVGNFFVNHRTAAVVGTVGAAAVGVGHMMNKRSERAAIDNMNQLEMAQAQQASMAQAQANTVTPAEYAAMEARMKQGGQNGGFAAGIQAERAAAASATPTV